MSVNPERLQYLLNQNAERKCSKEEMQELYQYIAAATDDDLYPQFDEQFDKTVDTNEVTDVDWEFMLQSILAEKQDEKQLAPVRSLWLKRIAVAASVLLALSFGIYFLLQNKPEQQQKLVENKTDKDVKAPGINKASITLIDGTIVSLDSLTNGVLAQQSNTKLVKLADGRIAYENESGELTGELQYNTLHNPRGSKVIDMLLSDGSHVWLNAGSSVTYPVAFVGKERNIKIEGEAYFEVVKNPSKPFIVNIADKAEVEVLGTHFNINSYSDEPILKTTLIEGRVKIRKGENYVFLNPGQQAIIANEQSNNIVIENDIDIDEVLAWKNGLFNFNGQDIEAIMRDISRWYNIEVSFEGKINKEPYSGIVSRNSNISQVLKIIEAGGVKFTFKENKIIVIQ